MELAPLPTSTPVRPWLLVPYPPALLSCPHVISQGSSFWYLLGVKSCESGKKLVKNRLWPVGRLGGPLGSRPLLLGTLSGPGGEAPGRGAASWLSVAVAPGRVRGQEKHLAHQVWHPMCFCSRAQSSPRRKLPDARSSPCPLFRK